MADVRRDARTDAVLRRVDMPSFEPDEAFIRASTQALLPRVRAARRLDATLPGRLGREVRAAIHLAVGTSPARSFRLVGLTALLVLAMLAGLIVVGVLHRPEPLGNGLLIVSVKGQLEAIDPATGAARPIAPTGDKSEGVSRSPDGRLATYWVNEPERSRLFAADIDTGEKRELASDQVVVWNQASDAWSPDSQRLAAIVAIGGVSRILVIEVATGSARLLTPPDVTVGNVLWSPDSRAVAFTRVAAPTGHTMSMIEADGTGMHDVAGLEGLDVNGADSWSPDGQWIYFGAGDSKGEHVFRINVRRGLREQLSAARQVAPGIVASPDGKMILFNVDAAYGFDSWVANSDGNAPRLLLPSGGIGTWSPDGTLIALNWRPPGEQGGLVTIKPDGTGKTVLVPFDSSCRDGWDQTCTLGYGWGVPRP